MGIPNLERYDDGGSFDRIVAEIRAVESDPDKVKDLLAEKILPRFISKIREENEKKGLAVLLDLHVPKKKRGSVAVKNLDQKIFFNGEKNEKKEPQKKRRRTHTAKLVELGGSAILPAELSTMIQNKGGSNVVLVVVKPLFKTDLNPHHARFTIPLKQVRGKFLTTEEEKDLDDGGDLKVKLIEPCLEEADMRLKKWKMRKNSIYALLTGWNPVMKKEKNALKENEVVQLWSYRCDGKLCFALSHRQT